MGPIMDAVQKLNGFKISTATSIIDKPAPSKTAIPQLWKEYLALPHELRIKIITFAAAQPTTIKLSTYMPQNKRVVPSEGLLFAAQGLESEAFRAHISQNSFEFADWIHFDITCQQFRMKQERRFPGMTAIEMQDELTSIHVHVYGVQSELQLAQEGVRRRVRQPATNELSDLKGKRCEDAERFLLELEKCKKLRHLTWPVEHNGYLPSLTHQTKTDLIVFYLRELKASKICKLESFGVIWCNALEEMDIVVERARMDEEVRATTSALMAGVNYTICRSMFSERKWQSIANVQYSATRD